MAVHEKLPNLYLVDLDQPLEGFRTFIAAWVLRRGSSALVVDPGPRSTIGVLLAGLEELGIERLEWVLLTHIHLDHAGGAGLLLERYPEAQVVCHPAGVPHLVDPAKLWAGSLKVLGGVADAYGEASAVPQASVAAQGPHRFGELEIRLVETPGHAAHHACFLAGDLLFGGEVAGSTYPVEGPYLRLATPPVFRYETSRGSLEKARSLGAARYCFGHYGLAEDPRWVFEAARDQLDRWMEAVRRQPARDEGWEGRVFRELLGSDPWLAPYARLPEDVRTREEYFAFQSLRGIRSSLEA
jgi:glyoxylase-like metal-dependent hydrolase (beta-lactamase superfamily II)